MAVHFPAQYSYDKEKGYKTENCSRILWITMVLFGKQGE